MEMSTNWSHVSSQDCGWSSIVENVLFVEEVNDVVEQCLFKKKVMMVRIN